MERGKTQTELFRYPTSMGSGCRLKRAQTVKPRLTPDAMQTISIYSYYNQNNSNLLGSPEPRMSSTTPTQHHHRHQHNQSANSTVLSQMNQPTVSESSQATNHTSSTRTGTTTTQSSSAGNGSGKNLATNLLSYQAPLVDARVPKKLFDSSINVDDLRDIRSAVGSTGSTTKNNPIRRRQNNQMSRQLIKDLEMDAYFSNKSNWMDKSKFVNTQSYYSAVKIYLPIIKKHSINGISRNSSSMRHMSASPPKWISKCPWLSEAKFNLTKGQLIKPLAYIFYFFLLSESIISNNTALNLLSIFVKTKNMIMIVAITLLLKQKKNKNKTEDLD